MVVRSEFWSVAGGGGEEGGFWFLLLDDWRLGLSVNVAFVVWNFQQKDRRNSRVNTVLRRGLDEEEEEKEGEDP